ncbi:MULTISPECIES: OmpP1/FadL family transporter [unclassified Pseudomonas]|uniref:Outer membrane protein transport protein n=1 Tax=Pseudomonas sp. MYb327 TaxID=2745230 RepID=A0AAU8E4V3_9PSED
MKKVMLKTTISLAVAMASTQIFASGFALNEQSISGMGTGFAGRSSSADDASTIAGNPAGMSRLKREQVTGGVAFIDAHTDISDVSARNGGTNKGDMVPFMGVPMGYYVKPIDDQWAVGFGVYAPFGLVTDYENGFAGRYFGSKSEVKIITFQPTVSYAFNDKVSIGFGPTINRIDGKLESNLSLSPNPAAPDGEVKIKGDDTALGYNIGILVQTTDSTRVGLTYHSKVKYKLDGDTKLDYSLLGPLGQQKFDASLDITTPESVDFSVTHQLDDQWTLYAGSTWTRWSRLKEISVENEGVPALLAARGFGTITEEQNWHDTWAHAIGASYQLNKQWVLRTGLSVDQSPTNNENRSPRIPTGDRKIFSLGAGWSPTDDLTIDVAYSYLREESVKVNDDNDRQNYSAKYENWANGFGIGATYRF